MKSKMKWSSIVVVIVLLFGYTHCDLMLTPQNGKVNYKNRKNASISSTEQTSLPTEISTPSADYANAYSYYEEVINPKLEQQSCFLCHSSSGGAPLSITNYDDLKGMLLDGKLIGKMTGSQSHGGGVKCSSSTSDICENFSEWYALEFSQNNQQPPSQGNNAVNMLTGGIDTVSALGKVTGHAAKRDAPSETQVVEFYFDGPKGMGQLIGTVNANLPGGEVSGNHGFIFFIPTQYRDGQARQLYAYVGNESILSSPRTVRAYTPSIEGFDYYQANVKPALDNRCARCHAVNYDQHFNSLLSPTPSGGGTATNNEMINMPSGSHNGVNHPGGNICGDKNSSPCFEIQTWWGIEFN
jgi:hypothetical protein